MFEYLEGVIEGDQGQYPSKSRAQYCDYLDTISNELALDMTDYETDLRDRAILEQEYRDAIHAVHESKDKFNEQQASEWASEFHRTLDGSQVAGDWRTPSHGTRNHYLHVYRRDWMLDDETLTVGTEDWSVTALYMIPFSPDNLDTREVEMNLKISGKWIDSSIGDDLRTYVNSHTDRFDSFIQEDNRIRQSNGSAVYTLHVPYDIEDGHSVGEQLADAVIETDATLHEEVSALFGEAVGSIAQ